MVFQRACFAAVPYFGTLLMCPHFALTWALSLLPLLSLQAIVLAACYPTDWPLLVVCPTSLLASWAVELEAWLPPLFKAPGGQPLILTIPSDKDRKRLLGAGEGVSGTLSGSAACACELINSAVYALLELLPTPTLSVETYITARIMVGELGVSAIM
jgi:hypothetical protein